MDELRTPTRKQYLNHEVTHAEYYRAVAITAGLSYKNADPQFLDRVRECLAHGDEHLNMIPLKTWDHRGYSVFSAPKAFKLHGDFATAAGLVCLVKQAALDAVNGVR